MFTINSTNPYVKLTVDDVIRLWREAACARFWPMLNGFSPETYGPRHDVPNSASKCAVNLVHV